MGASFGCPGFAIQPVIGSITPANDLTYAPSVFSVKAHGASPALPAHKIVQCRKALSPFLSAATDRFCAILGVLGDPWQDHEPRVSRRARGIGVASLQWVHLPLSS
jgi:hypothetical protein